MGVVYGIRPLIGYSLTDVVLKLSCHGDVLTSRRGTRCESIKPGVSTRFVTEFSRHLPGTFYRRSLDT